jgi:hypothetical protein
MYCSIIICGDWGILRNSSITITNMQPGIQTRESQIRTSTHSIAMRSVICRSPLMIRPTDWLIVRFQVLAAATSNITVFYGVALCSFVETDHSFAGAYCLHHRPDGDSKHLWNVGLLRDYTGLHPRKLSSCKCLDCLQVSPSLWSSSLNNRKWHIPWKLIITVFVWYILLGTVECAKTVLWKMPVRTHAADLFVI